jgi:putative transposase
MNEVSLLPSLGQVSASQAAEIFRNFLRGHVREMNCEVMVAEVTELCGLKHSPLTTDHYRSGNCPGRVLVEGEREESVRHRVPRKGEDGLSRGVEFATYPCVSAWGHILFQRCWLPTFSAWLCNRRLFALAKPNPSLE